jgi:hypothetical protein
LVFKAKKQKQKPFGNCTVSLRQGCAAFWRLLQLERGFAGLLLSRVKACFIACFVLSAPDNLTEHLLLSCTFLKCADQPGYKLRFCVCRSLCSLTCPLWEADVHTTCHVHLKTGHLAGTLGILPWAWLTQLTFHLFVFVFLFL